MGSICPPEISRCPWGPSVASKIHQGFQDLSVSSRLHENPWDLSVPPRSISFQHPSGSPGSINVPLDPSVPQETSVSLGSISVTRIYQCLPESTSVCQCLYDPSVFPASTMPLCGWVRPRAWRCQEAKRAAGCCGIGSTEVCRSCEPQGGLSQGGPFSQVQERADTGPCRCTRLAAASCLEPVQGASPPPLRDVGA